MAAHESRESDEVPEAQVISGTTEQGSPSRRRKGADRDRRGEKQSFWSWLLELVLIALIALLLSSLIRNFLMEMYIIPSGSMENTLQISDRIVVVHVAPIHRGNVVVFKDPGGWLAPAPNSSSSTRRVFEFLGVMPSTYADHLVKRVIGMPGDHVKCCDVQGRITVNGVALDEDSYLYEFNGVSVRPSNTNFDVVVPAGHIFVLGDHRDESRDSRPHLCDLVPAGEVPGSGAFVPMSDVTGPGVAIAMPFSRTKSLTIPATFASIPPPTAPAPERAAVTESSCP